MATYTQEYDAALLQVPWLSKVDSTSKPFLLKYTRHPTKPGFVVLLTDLTKVYFEPLVGIRLLARQREVEEKYGASQRANDGGSSLDVGGEEAVEEVLEQVGALMGDELGGAEMTVAIGDLYDLDVSVRSESAGWLFHMTEIRYGCLEIITRHIVHPLALSISSSRRPQNTTDGQIVELVSSKIVLDAIGQHSAGPTPSSKQSKPVRANNNSRRAESPPAEDHRGKDEAGPSRLVRRRPQEARDSSKAEASSPKRQAAKKSLSPSPPARSPPRKRETEHMTEDQEDEVMPEEPSSPPPPRRTGHAPKHRTPTPQVQAPEAEQEQNPEKDGSPEAPSLPPPSQKSQKEKDEEEEAELERKREEMKRKMGSGSGGRLVRRRFGR